MDNSTSPSALSSHQSGQGDDDQLKLSNPANLTTSSADRNSTFGSGWSTLASSTSPSSDGSNQPQHLLSNPANLTTSSSDPNSTFAPGWSTLANSTSSPPLPSGSGANYSTTTNSTNNLSPLLTTTPLISSSMTSSQLVSTDLPSPSVSPELGNPNPMGHVELNATIWQQPGIIIALTCSLLGLLCLISGLACHLYKRQKTRKPIRGLRVVSGFDFNGGGDDDYGNYNVWDGPAPALGSAAADKAEKAAFEYDGPLTVMGSIRHSNASFYSNADDDHPHHDRRCSSSHFPCTDEKGIAM